MSVELGHKQFTREMYIAPIGDDFLLGCNMVDELDITINSKRGIQIDEKWIDCDVERETEEKLARLVLTENVTIPANSEIIFVWLDRKIRNNRHQICHVTTNCGR